MEDLRGVKELLDEINAAISSYDPVFKERARDILLERAFGGGSAPRTRRAPASTGGGGEESDEGGDEAPRRRPGRPKGSGTGRRGPRGGMAMPNLLGQWTPETMAERALM